MTDGVNGIYIEEPSGGIRFGTDALLLAFFMLPHAGKRGLDLGTGSGIIPLLYLSRDSRAIITGIEIQPEYAVAAERNSEFNRLSNRFSVLTGDLRESKKLFAAGSFDFVFSNPPYHRVGSGRNSESTSRNTAFRETDCGIDDIAAAAEHSLNNGGRFYAVYRPERLSSLLFAMKSHRIEPKRLTPVLPDPWARPSLMLVEGRKSGAEGLSVTQNFYQYSDRLHKTPSNAYRELLSTFGGIYTR